MLIVIQHHYTAYILEHGMEKRINLAAQCHVSMCVYWDLNYKVSDHLHLKIHNLFKVLTVSDELSAQIINKPQIQTSV